MESTLTDRIIVFVFFLSISNRFGYARMHRPLFGFKADFSSSTFSCFFT